MAPSGAAEKRVLLTGFEPYGGRGRNPAAEVATALDGRVIAGFSVVGRRLPVSYRGLAERLEALIDEVRPAIAISLGLWPGEETIRLERFGLNLAHFEIADNDGVRLEDEVIAANGATGMRATLPLRAIERAMLDGGIPVRLSSSAGTYLCNVTLYTLMRALEERAPLALGGFIHIPYIPEQVAGMLLEAKSDRRLELHQRADFASMALADIERAVAIAIATSAAEVAARS